MSTRSDLISAPQNSAMSVALTLSGAGFLRDLTATFNRLAPPWTIVPIMVDSIEDRSGVGKKCAKPVDHQAFQIAGRYPPAAGTVFSAPVTREVETSYR
jgi:hypothetical protein